MMTYGVKLKAPTGRDEKAQGIALGTEYALFPSPEGAI